MEKNLIFHLQLKPLNWFTLGHKQTDSNNRLIIKSKSAFMYEHYVCKSSLRLVDLNKFDHNNRLISLSVIPLKGAHCSYVVLVS